MNMIGNISIKAAEQNLPFLLIGGYAVMAHGYIRTTEDVDLLVRKNQAAEWRKIIEDLGFPVFSTNENFMQFSPAPDINLKLDLMFARDETFDLMLAEAKLTTTSGLTAKVVSLPHLFALKCHAFRSKPHRALKDIVDVVELVKINRLDLNEPSLRNTLIEHGGQDFYELLKRECSGS